MQPLARRRDKLMLLGPSTFARYDFVVLTKANIPQLQICVSAADPRQMFSEILRGSLCSSAYDTRPVLILITPSAPMS